LGFKVGLILVLFGILHRREIRSKRKSGVVSKISFGLRLELV